MIRSPRALRFAGLVLAGITLLLGAGCATVTDFERFQTSWIDRSIVEYMAETGASPTRITPNPKGDLYLFSYERTIETPSTTAATSPTIDGVPTAPVSPYPGAAQSTVQWCRWVFQVDRSKIITGFRYDGNACRL